MKREKSANVVVDARGTFCPVPVIRTAEAARNLEAGSVIEVLSDDPAIEFDLPAWCKSMGHEIVSSIREGDVFKYKLVTGKGANGS